MEKEDYAKFGFWIARIQTNLGNKEEAETDIAVRRSEEEEFSRTHPTPPETKERFDRMRQQMPARRT